MKQKTFFNWSSGKDSALALHYLIRDGNSSIDRLLTKVNAHHDRVSMHGLRKSALEAQAAAMGISLDVLEVPENPNREQYNTLMKNKVLDLKSQGYTHTAYGDIFLEDLKRYKEDMLLPLGVEAVFPLWKKDTTALLREFLDLGFRAVIVCVNQFKLDKSFLGKELSLGLMEKFPKNVDPCGENGEFHTFCFDGPIFNYPIPFTLGEVVFKSYDDPIGEANQIPFGFCDILLKR